MDAEVLNPKTSARAVANQNCLWPDVEPLHFLLPDFPITVERTRHLRCCSRNIFFEQLSLQPLQPMRVAHAGSLRVIIFLLARPTVQNNRVFHKLYCLNLITWAS